MEIDPNTPVLVGVGQVTERNADPATAKEPLDLMLESVVRAVEDAGLPPATLEKLDKVAVVNLLACSYANAPGALAEKLGARPVQLDYTTVGGNTPQWLVNETAAQIATGERNFALLTGAEAVSTLNKARRAQVPLNWSSGKSQLPDAKIVGTRRQGVNDLEMNYGLALPTSVYPLFENALRHHHGWTLEEHRRQIGRLCARMTEVAAQNPYAWFPQKRSPEELMTVTAQNRIIGFPYPKLVNAILDVDQGAAVLMTSVETARRMGIDPARWVYWIGGADASDHWFVSDRVNYFSSPAIRTCGRRALDLAGLTIEQIDHLDLYSCFPSAVQIARDMLGIAIDDPRPLTVTGGLPYAGGPGNNYVMHSIATMVQRLRSEPTHYGLVTALGWYLTKHSVGIYTATAPRQSFRREDPALAQAEVDAMPHPEIVAEADGPAVIETYTVLHDREGTPVRGIVIGRLDDGRRFLANTPADLSLFTELEQHEAIGRRGRVSFRDGANCFDF